MIGIVVQRPLVSRSLAESLSYWPACRALQMQNGVGDSDPIPDRGDEEATFQFSSAPAVFRRG